MFKIISRIRSGTLSTAFLLLGSVAIADESVITLHEDVEWRAMGTSGTQMAVLTGEPTPADPYAVMIKVPDGALWQPDPLSSAWRHITVISGTLVWTIGDSFENGSMTALSPGSFWTVPTGANQRGWASNGDVLAVVTAMGPSSTSSVDEDRRRIGAAFGGNSGN